MFSRKKRQQREESRHHCFVHDTPWDSAQLMRSMYYAVIFKPGPPYTRPKPESYLGDMDTLVTIPAVSRRHDGD
jgi:hypothetical protein